MALETVVEFAASTFRRYVVNASSQLVASLLVPSHLPSCFVLQPSFNRGIRTAVWQADFRAVLVFVREGDGPVHQEEIELFDLQLAEDLLDTRYNPLRISWSSPAVVSIWKLRDNI